MKSSSPSEKKWTLVSICFWAVIKLTVWIFTGWLVALMIGFGLYIFLGHQTSMVYLQQLTLKQTQYLTQLPALFWLKNPAILMASILQWLDINLIFKTKAFVQLGQNKLQLLQPRYERYKIINHIIQTGMSYLIDSISLFLLVTKLTLLRLIAIILFLPIFVLVGCLGFMDGLIQRDLRRLSGGRESALLYHRARSALIPLLFWSGFLYLVLPFNLNPNQLLLPFALCFAFAVWLTAKMFKKYL